MRLAEWLPGEEEVEEEEGKEEGVDDCPRFDTRIHISLAATFCVILFRMSSIREKMLLLWYE